MQEAKWFDFEEAYRQHGLMPDQQDAPVRKPVKKTVKKTSSFTARDKKIALTLVAIVAIFGIISILSAAFTATLKFQVNSLISANETLENEIADMDIKLQTANSITNLEKKAKNKLGMKYPSSSQIVYIDDIETPGDIASVVSEAANN